MKVSKGNNRISKSRAFHNVAAAYTKDLSKNELAHVLLIGGTHNKQGSKDARVHMVHYHYPMGTVIDEWITVAVILINSPHFNITSINTSNKCIHILLITGIRKVYTRNAGSK